MEMFKAVAKIDIRHVAYRGGNPQLNDLAVAYYQTAFELFRQRRYN